MSRLSKLGRDKVDAYARMVRAARLAVPPLTAAAHQLRGMGDCASCGDFDTNPQARAIEDALDTLNRALAHFDNVHGRAPGPERSKT